jgi:hypothetical protein
VSDNPYQSQTDANTSQTWLNDMKPVDVHIHGLVDYAKSMVTASDNLKNHQGRVTDQLSSLPQDAFGRSAFPEAAYTLTLCMQNLGEFTSYLGFLDAAIMNTGNAAQTIADCYQGTDGWSAASLDAVQFAYGDPDATRPAGLPSVIGKTWYDAYFEQLAKDQAAAASGGGPASAHEWHVVSSGKYDGGGGYTIYEDQYGNYRSVNVTYVDGKKVTFDNEPDGTTETTEYTASYPGGSVTTKTTVKPDGTTSTTSSNVVYSTDAKGDGISTTTVNNGNGEPTSQTVRTTHPDGSVTTTSYSYKDGKWEETDQVTVGAEDPAVGTPVTSPMQGLGG